MINLRRRRLWLVLLGIAVAAVLAVTAISYFAAGALLHHRSARPAVTPADSGLTYQVVPLQARDGTKLEGWWIIPKDGVRRRDLATVVLAHAADGEIPGALTGKAGMLRHAAWLSRAGFIVLAFDFRSYGGSEGTRTTGGEEEAQDLAAALRLARERAIDAPLAIFGEGLGGRVGLQIIARDPSVKALVADSPARSRMQVLEASAPFWTRLAIPSAVLPEPDEEMPFPDLVRMASVRPVMFIVGNEYPGWNRSFRNETLHGLGRENVTWLFEIPHARRFQGLGTKGVEYEKRVREFLDAAFARDDSTRTMGKPMDS